MPRFKDAPLGKNQFRLFKIKQHTRDIEVEVQTFKIYRAPKYEAVSYCWGDKSDGTTIIRCNGKPLEVWANLYSALRRLHKENSGSWYWSDALCIEQGDEEVAVTEKARQIAFMGTIFTLAEPVRVWLGDASKEEEQAFQYLADLSEHLAKNGVFRDDTGMPGPKDQIWLYWSQIILRPWFARLWIVQESLVSAGKLIVTLGNRTQTTWANFHEMIARTGSVPWAQQPLKYDTLDAQAQLTVDRDFLTEWGISLDECHDEEPQRWRNNAFQSYLYRNIVNIRELMFFEKYHDEDYGYLQQVLKVFGNRTGTYDQDRPNAMRGILTGRLKKGLKVYDIHADPATVYREVTRLWLTNDPTLSLLQRIRPLNKFLPEYNQASGTKLKNPSWVIDLGRVAIETLGDGIPNKVDGFHAGLIRSTSWSGKHEWKVPETSTLSRTKGPRHVQFSTENQCHIAGVQIGTVQSIIFLKSRPVRPDLLRSSESFQQSTDFEQWVSDSFDLVQSVDPNPESSREVHWRTLVLNETEKRDPDVIRMFDIENKHSRRKAYENFLEILKFSKPELLRQADDATARYYNRVDRLQRAFPNWFSTSNGHVGRSYAVPKAGDVVAVLYGASTPFLLHPVLGRETYEFMGEAYAHGIMQGEALHEKNKARYPKQIFKLV